MKTKKTYLIVVLLLVVIFYLGAFVIDNVLIWTGRAVYRLIPNEVPAVAFLNVAYTVESFSGYGRGDNEKGRDYADQSLTLAGETIELVKKTEDKSMEEKNNFILSSIQLNQLILPLAADGYQQKYYPQFIEELELITNYYLKDGLNIYVLDGQPNIACIYGGFIHYAAYISDAESLDRIKASLMSLEKDNIVCPETEKVTADQFQQRIDLKKNGISKPVGLMYYVDRLLISPVKSWWSLVDVA